jgi:hypothetical protein
MVVDSSAAVPATTRLTATNRGAAPARPAPMNRGAAPTRPAPTNRGPAAVADAFVAIAHRIVWCTLATVDRRGRPRSRVVHPIWQRAGDGLVGWLVTRPTPLKLAHLAHGPYVSCSYWDSRHDVAVAECRAAWVPDVGTRARAWELFRAAAPPLGYDPATMFPEGPGGDGAAVLRLDPWRLRAADVETLAAGRPARVWRSAGGLAVEGDAGDDERDPGDLDR